MYNLWNQYGTIVATGPLCAIMNHHINLVNAGHGAFDSYDIIEVGQPQFPWED